MDADFWHDRWKNNQLGFHQPAPNPLLVAHFGRLNLPAGAHVFVPLCGKSNDLGWLLQQGFKVTGAELSEIAINDLFTGLGLSPEITQEGPLRRYQAHDLTVYVGDIFDMNAAHLGRVNAIYDRAALVALPPDMRSRYAAHLGDITGNALQFVICFEYDQSEMTGPPFSISEAEVRRLYEGTYALSSVAKIDVEGGMKGMIPAQETVWYLR